MVALAEGKAFVAAASQSWVDRAIGDGQDLGTPQRRAAATTACYTCQLPAPDSEG